MKVIAAHNLNRVIGHKGIIPFESTRDLYLFKAFTIDSTVIMGRKTFQSLGKPLVRRLNVIVSRNFPAGENVIVCGSPQEAFERFPHAWVIGGEQIYRAAFQSGRVERVLLTVVRDCSKGDTYFPEMPPNFMGCKYFEDNEAEYWSYTRSDNGQKD